MRFVFLLFMAMLVIAMAAVVVTGDIEESWEIWSDVVYGRSSLVEPSIVNTAPATEGRSISYLVDVTWKGNATLVSVVINNLELRAYLDAYGITIDRGYLSEVKNYLLPDKDLGSGLAYTVNGLPVISFKYKLLDLEYYPDNATVLIYTPIMSLWHQFQDSYDYLAVVLKGVPIKNVTTNEITSFYVRLEWFNGRFNKTTGDIVIERISNVNLNVDWNTFLENGIHFYLIPEFFSYVDPGEATRYLIVGYRYKVKCGTASNETAFAWENIPLYNVSQANYAEFNKAVESVLGWDVWIGEGLYLYRSRLPPIQWIVYSELIYEYRVKAKIMDPIVYDTYPDPGKLYNMFHNDQLAYYTPPENLMGLDTQLQQGNILIDIAIMTIFAVGAGVGASFFLPRKYSVLLGAPVMTAAIYIMSPDPRLIIITVLAIAVALIENQGLEIT